jgi:hypothetical protein
MYMHVIGECQVGGREGVARAEGVRRRVVSLESANLDAKRWQVN